MKIANYSLSGTYRTQLNETTFVFTIEPSINNRPIIMFFLVDASHSMRFYIDDAKTIQRQSLVQAVAQLGINDHEIIQNNDYLGLFTFSTEVKSLLEKPLVEITEQNRNDIDQIITNALKSDGGQTNYGKMFDEILEIIKNLPNEFPADSPHLSGPVLIWFLTDGRPWPEVAGNTADDIFDYATTLGETGNELWIIGISQDANKEFLDKIALASQLGLTDYNKKIQDLPKEFLLEEFISEKTLWVDLDLSSQEKMMHGLVNAIEGARTNLGIVAEVEIIFDSPIALQFEIGVNEVLRDGSKTIVKLRRYDFLKIGQKMSMAFSLLTRDNLLATTKLHSIKLELFRGEHKISEEETIYDQILTELVKEENKLIIGSKEVSESFKTIRENLKQMAFQVQDVLSSMEVLESTDESFTRNTEKFEEIRKFLT